LAASPKSDCQISPLYAAGIVFFHPIENLQRLVGKLIAHFQSFPPRLEFQELVRQHPSFGQGKMGNFLHDFSHAHAITLMCCIQGFNLELNPFLVPKYLEPYFFFTTSSDDLEATNL
jgi:hypothetical protein